MVQNALERGVLASSSAVSGAQGLEDLVATGAHGSAPQNLDREDMFQKSMNNIIPLGLHGDGGALCNQNERFPGALVLDFGC